MSDDQDRASGPGEAERASPSSPQYVTQIESVQGTVNIGPSIQAGRPAAGVEEALDDTGYDLGAVRRLLTASFTPQELRRFCQDRTLFRPIVNRFGPGQGLDDMVQEVIDYCATRLLWEDLLAEVKEARPRQYDRFAAALRPEMPDVPPAGGSIGLPDALLKELRQRVRRYAPEAVQAEALEQVSALGAGFESSPPDLAAVESAWRWFDGELPALSGAVLRLILDAGRRLAEEGDDATWAEFRQRFGES
ncbi:MAG: hypothetical protein PVF47_12440 [Anaerolineae bacterium]|jgi:hypothetical protein